MGAAQVVFSTACWIGTKEENPEEEQMAWPESVLAAEPAADELDPLDPLAAPAGTFSPSTACAIQSRICFGQSTVCCV